MEEMLNEFVQFLSLYDPECDDDDFENFCTHMESYWFQICTNNPTLNKQTFIDTLICKCIHQDVINELLAIDKDYTLSQSNNSLNNLDVSSTNSYTAPCDQEKAESSSKTNSFIEERVDAPTVFDEILKLPQGWDIDDLLVPDEYMDSTMISLRQEIDAIINNCTCKINTIKSKEQEICDLNVAKKAILSQTKKLIEEEARVSEQYHKLKKEAFKYEQLLSTDPLIPFLWPYFRDGENYSTNSLEEYFKQLIARIEQHYPQKSTWLKIPSLHIDPFEELSNTQYILTNVKEQIYLYLRNEAEEWIYDNYDMLICQSQLAMGKLCSKLISNARIKGEFGETNQVEWNFIEHDQPIFTISFYGIPSAIYYSLRQFNVTIRSQNHVRIDSLISLQYLNQEITENREFSKACLFFGCILCAVVLGFFSNFSPEINASKTLYEQRPIVSKKMRLYEYIDNLLSRFKQTERDEMLRVYTLFNNMWNIEEYIGILKIGKKLNGIERFINRN